MCLLNCAHVKDHLHDSENWPRSPFERSKLVRSSSTLRIVLKLCVDVIGRTWIHLVTCSKIESPWPTLLQSLRARQNLWNLHFRSLSTRVVWPKVIFGLWQRKKRELESNLTIFETCVLNPFHGQKMQENFFLTGSWEDRS